MEKEGRGTGRSPFFWRLMHKKHSKKDIIMSCFCCKAGLGSGGQDPNIR